jgi:hypothetical protein
MNFTDRGLDINGNLFISGEIINSSFLKLVINNLKLKTKVISLENDLFNASNDLKQLQKDIDKLKDMVNSLWFAPNMPGYITAKSSYNQVYNKSIKD